MLMPDTTRPDRYPVKGPYALTRNNLELAAIVVYFFALAVLIAFSLIVMIFQPGDRKNARSANEHHSEVVVTLQ
jgi:hypothetical protein